MFEELDASSSRGVSDEQPAALLPVASRQPHVEGSGCSRCWVVVDVLVEHSGSELKVTAGLRRAGALDEGGSTSEA